MIQLKRLLILLALLIAPTVSRAQSTLVSGTVTDTGGVAWVNGTYTFTSAAYPNVAIISGTLDSTGSFTNITFPVNNFTSNVGSRWTAKICPLITAPCFSTTVIIAYTTPISLTSFLIPGAITIDALKPPPITAYSDTEIINAVQGSRYLNVTDKTEHVCTALPCSSNWQSIANSGGSISFTGVVTNKNANTQRFVGCLNPQGWTGADVGAWVNSAIVDIGTGNAGTIYVSGTCSFSTTINANTTNGIKIIGQASSNGGAPAGVALTYTGTGSAVTSQNSLGFRFSQISLTWNNAAFVGPLIALDGTTATFDNEIDHNTFGSGVPANNAPVILSMDKTENSNIHHNAFYHYVIGIKGAANSGSFSNANSVDYNNFSESQPNGMAVTAHIQNPGQGWSISRNTFEMGTLVGTPAVVNFTGGATALGVAVTGNWIGDAGTGTWTYFPIQGGGWIFEGNYFGGTTAGTTVISTPASFQGLAVKGNYFDHHATGIALGATNTQLDIGGNGFGSVTNFITGGPSSGVTIDGSNNINIYSPGSFIDSAGNTRVNFTATNNQFTAVGAGSHQFTGPVSLVEQAAPSGFGTLDMLYGDSTTHRASVSNNGGGVKTLALTVQADTLRESIFIADQGTACTNGELALSAGWGNTAAATAVAGNGQTCSWTITASGTGQAANPTVTDTLTNALPTATTVCEVNMHGGTGANSLFLQTTLSATAPIFTFQGTPGAGLTYLITRRCGP